MTSFAEVGSRKAAAVPDGRSLAGGINQDAAHDLSAGAVKMRFAFPARLTDIHQFQVDLVHKRGRLQRVLFSLSPCERGGHATKFPVNVRSKRVERSFVPIGPVKKKLSCFRDLWFHGP